MLYESHLHRLALNLKPVAGILKTLHVVAATIQQLSYGEAEKCILLALISLEHNSILNSPISTP